MNKNKQINPKDNDEDEDFTIKIPAKIILRVGEIEIATNSGTLKDCEKTIHSCLNKKLIRNYLYSYDKKKMLNSSLSYVE